MTSALATPNTNPRAELRADEPIYGDVPALYALGIVTPVRAAAKRRIRLWPVTVSLLTVVLASLTAVALYLLGQGPL